jgi:hypothetical protein
MCQHDGNHGQTYSAKMEARVFCFPCLPVSQKGKSPAPWANWTTSLILTGAWKNFGRSGPAAYPIPTCPNWRDSCQVGETPTWRRFVYRIAAEVCGLVPGWLTGTMLRNIPGGLGDWNSRNVYLLDPKAVGAG